MDATTILEDCKRMKELAEEVKQGRPCLKCAVQAATPEGFCQEHQDEKNALRQKRNRVRRTLEEISCAAEDLYQNSEDVADWEDDIDKIYDLLVKDLWQSLEDRRTP